MRSGLLPRLLARFSRLSATVRLMTTLPAHPRIPYGEANFQRIRRHRWLYVDKTRFVRRLEDERYAFLIRPRRFGKTLWVSLLENYYGRHLEGEFDAVFAGTDIGRTRRRSAAATSSCVSTSRW